MRSAELLTLGVEGLLNDRLAAWSLDHGLWYRPLQHPAALLNLLRKGSRGVLLVSVGRDVVGELELVRHVCHEFAEVPTIVLGGVDHPRLEGLAYDLGATAVVFPPRGADEVFEILTLWTDSLRKANERRT